MSEITFIELGVPGPKGNDGADGAQGPQGPAGAPATSYGTEGAPELITVTGPTLHGGPNEIHFMKGNGGAVVVTSAFPAGNAVGDRLTLICDDAVNTVQYNNGSGLSLRSDSVKLGEIGSSILELMWTGSLFREINRV